MDRDKHNEEIEKALRIFLDKEKESFNNNFSQNFLG